MKLKTYIISVALASTCIGLSTSCDDMLDMGNDYVIYADDQELVDPADTVTSVLGILNKLQAIAVRNNLFGEVRADLVTVTSAASSDLKDIASHDVDDENSYNVPRDYYAVINNCNYYLSVADSTAGNTSRNEKYFENEIAQVHSIRAWTYLQLVLVYGKVPLVTEPILTMEQSKASYPMTDLTGICEYFINDLQPYYATEYPDWETVGGDIDPKMCFFPTQIVMGDMYLYLAAAYQDPEYAKSAAKCYYDYIMWDLSEKTYTFTQTNRWYWAENSITNSMYRSPSSNTSSSSTWGSTYCDDITMIPMDSAAADGYYNELRNLYNTTNVTEYTAASIAPSDSLIALSERQDYYGWNSNTSTLVKVSESDLEDEAIENYYLGDLRFQKDYNTRTQRSGSTEYEYQTINKHNSQHISIYRTTQLYLRLAEALNYAGYPRFARQILTMGLSNYVIQYEVSPYYTTATDSAFIDYFQFNTTSFLPFNSSYSTRYDDYGIPYYIAANRELSSCNTLGVHARGCGDIYRMTDDSYYCTLCTPDSTDYPYALREAVPEEPTAPTVVNKPSDTAMDYEAWSEYWSANNTSSPTEARYNSYYSRWEDSVANYTAYVEEYAVYQEDSTVYANALSAFQDAYYEWYNAAYSDPSFITKEQKIVDQAILDEQALELSYEGNRYYDLMRRAYWWNDNSIMSETIGVSKLSSRSNWFISWDGQIGYDADE